MDEEEEPTIDVIPNLTDEDEEDIGIEEAMGAYDEANQDE